MSQLNQSRYDQLLRRVGDLKGPGSKVNDVLGELFPVIDVEDVPLDLLLLSGTRIALGGTNDPAVPVRFQASMLNNPVGSGQIMTLLEASVASLIGQLIAHGPTQNTFSTPGVKAYVDLRAFPDGPTGRVLSSELLVAAPVFGLVRVESAIDTVLRPLKGLAVLSPGTSYAFSTTDDNTDFTVNYLWTERVAQPSELNL